MWTGDLVAGPGPVDGDQQVAPEGGGDLGDRGVQDLDVVGAGVGAGVAFSEHRHQQFAGVVAGGQQRMKPVGALECPFRSGLVGVGGHDRGVEPDHDRGAQVAVTRSGGRDLPVPGDDLVPHVGADGSAGPVDAAQLDGADLTQAAPGGGGGGYVPEQVVLVAQGLQVVDRGGAVGDGHGQVCEQSAPVDVGMPVAYGQRFAQCRGQADLVAEQAHQRRPDMGDHAFPGHSYPQIPRPSRTL